MPAVGNGSSAGSRSLIAAVVSSAEVVIGCDRLKGRNCGGGASEGVPDLKGCNGGGSLGVGLVEVDRGMAHSLAHERSQGRGRETVPPPCCRQRPVASCQYPGSIPSAPASFFYSGYSLGYWEKKLGSEKNWVVSYEPGQQCSGAGRLVAT